MIFNKILLVVLKVLMAFYFIDSTFSRLLYLYVIFYIL